MAITVGDRCLWRDLRAQGAIPARPRVLEIGRANWYGDIPAAAFVADVREFTGEVPPPRLTTWEAAALWYRALLREPQRTAIDLDPAAPDCLRLDLNDHLPAKLHDYFDLVINTGTTEHIFDQRRVWESIHEACRPSGLMAHAVPLWGWLDHGFVNYQPTWVADLAAENGYEVLSWWIAEITTGWAMKVASPREIAAYQHRAGAASAMMHFALRKTSDRPFRVPMQGVYSTRRTSELQESWAVNR